MAPIVAGLALAMPAMALQIVCSPSTNAMGLPGVYVRTNAFGALVFPTAFLASISLGPFGLVHAWWVAAPALLLWTLFLTLPHVGLTWRKLAAELAPILLANGIMAGVVYELSRWLPDWPSFIQLAVLGFAGAALYALVIKLAWPHLIAETWAMLRQRPEPVAAPPMDAAGSTEPSIV